MPHHDIVIIGSGSGNSLFTAELEKFDIAIVEEGIFGGTCLNVGCIPTKMFVYPAELIAEVRDGARLGLRGEPPTAQWQAVRDRVFGRIDPIASGGRSYRATGTPNATLYEAHASFTGPKTLELSTGETLTADRIVLAAGSRATAPPIVVESGVPFHTSDTIMRLDALPERLIIIGGGYIAAEFAHVFSAFGVDVSIITRGRLLGALDHDISDRLTSVVRDRWDLHLDARIAAVHGGAGDIHVELEDGTVVDGDLLLVATGRQPNGDRLNAAAGGLDLHPDGRVVVDSFQRTTAPDVWALGDVSTEHQLKHVANHEERVVAHNLAHPEELVESDHRFVPAAVFTHPQIAYVGLSEQQAQAAGRPFVSVVQEYGSTAFGWAMEDQTSICKLLADPSTGKLIGAHILGAQAATLIQPLIQAMSFGLGVKEMARGQYWIHPALTEVIENALLSLDL